MAHETAGIHWSLNTLLVAIIVTAVVVVLGMQSAFTFVSQRHAMQSQLKQSATLSITTLQKNAGPLIEAYAVNEYGKLIDTEIELRDLDAIVIEDYNLGAILGQTSHLSGKIHNKAGRIVDFDPEDPQHLEHLKNAFYQDTASILDQNGKSIGMVRVYASDDSINRELTDLLIRNLLNTLLIASLLIASLLFAIHRLLLRPLTTMVSALTRTDEDGIPQGRSPEFALREINILSETINHMVRLIKESRDSLHREHVRLQNVVEGTLAGTWEWNVQTGDAVFNERWARIIGYTLQELQPVSIQTWLQLTHPDDLRTSNAALRQHFDGVLPVYECEARMRHKDGHWVWVLDRGCVFSRSEDGKPLMMYGTHQEITQRKAMEASLIASEERLRYMLETSPIAVRIARTGGREVIFANQRYAELINHTGSDANGIDPGSYYSDAGTYRKVLDELGEGKQVFDMLVELNIPGFGRKWALASYLSMQYEGEPCVLGWFYDITDRKAAEAKLEEAASVFEHANEGILITDRHANILNVNHAFTQITGYSHDEVIGKNPRLLSSGRQDKLFYQEMWRTLLENGKWSGEIWNRGKGGNIYAQLLTISSILKPNGKPDRYLGLFTDITALKEHQHKLERIAHFDALTGLPNRSLLADRMQQAMAQSLRREEPLAVVFLDLDGFKQINDNYGHDAGDRLLITLTERMKHTLREGDTLARLGGDEFVAVLSDIKDINSCKPMLERLLAASSSPVNDQKAVLQVSASLGVSFFPQAEPIDADQLLRQADQAMYQAKQQGKNRYHLFDPEQDRSLRGQLESLDQIKRALAQQELVLHYQPKVNMHNGGIVGVEALIRWQHPERGLQAPATFLPIIEGHPLMVEVGDWVIDTALAQIAAWKSEGLDLQVSVNIAAQQIERPDFIEKLRASLARYPDVAPGNLELEVLETSALNDIAKTSRLIHDCQEIGIHFALDDFGTGYSSLSYLKHLPVKTIKIDQSFVRDMLDDPDDLAILDGILGMAVAFRRKCVAEGVETVEHGEMLLKMGCELAQGYAIAKPMQASMIREWIHQWMPNHAWSTSQPINRNDLPALFSMVEHRAWIANLARYVQDEQTNLPEMSSRDCRVGQWLYEAGKERYAGNPDFLLIARLHETLHDKAQVLVQLKLQGGHDEAQPVLAEIDALHEDLVNALKNLLKE